MNEPHTLAGVQLQVTPALALSLETVADTGALPPGWMDGGGIVERTTEMGCGPGWGPGPEELPPPQPDRYASARMIKKGRFRIMALHLNLYEAGRNFRTNIRNGVENW